MDLDLLMSATMASNGRIYLDLCLAWADQGCRAKKTNETIVPALLFDSFAPHVDDQHAAQRGNGWTSPRRRKRTSRKFPTTPPSVRPPRLYDGRNHDQRNDRSPTKKREEHSALCSDSAELRQGRNRLRAICISHLLRSWRKYSDFSLG